MCSCAHSSQTPGRSEKAFREDAAVADDDGSNRRKYGRVMTDSIVCVEPLKTFRTLAQALDLSLGGIRFQTIGLELDPSQVIRVTLTLGEETRTVTGRIVRLTDLDNFTQEVAISFIEIDADTQRLLLEHLPEVEEIGIL